MIKKFLLLAFIAFGSITMVAQTTVTGVVTDAASGETLPGANIKVSRKAVGTTTDFDGAFTLTVTDNPPFTIEISMLGFQTEKVEITKNNQKVEVKLTENATSLDEIVVSASRTPERIMESPVTIERMDTRAIKNTSAPSFYDGLENLKGVDINTNSLTFKSVNTRGFATFSNTRFMQLVDGMDNSSPALNFALGNLLGMSELDVKTVELLPGASSALYGANAFNGIMFMTSKSPFDDQGISLSLKSGLTSQDAAGDNMFYDTSIRMAYAFSNKFAAKATFSYLKGTEWFATDYRNTANGGYTSGDRNSDRNYDGLNVYGDEVSTNLRGVAQTLEGLGIIPNGASALIPNESVSRTGYDERDLMTYEAKSVKFGGSLNYRPFGDDRLEVIWNSKFGVGNTIYQGTNRYNIKDFFMEQHKLEFRGKNFFVRGYMTNEDAGNSYDTRFAAININRSWKDDNTWFGQYVGAYLQGTLGGLNSDQAHAIARQTAETGRLLPGTAGFQSALNKVSSDPDLVTGAKFQDATKYYHADANYNFQDVIDWAEFQVGGSYRLYSLNSNGSIFTDYDGPIEYNEYGVYTQAQKQFLEEDRLKVTASIRYDKAQNFDGNFSPRVSFAYAGGENKNQNFRASFQTGFRNPTTQDQYIGLNAGRGFLVGSAPDNLDRYTTSPLTVSGLGQNFTGSGTISVSGRAAYENAFSATSVEAFAAGQVAAPTNANVSLVKPEKVTAYEVGYRGLVEAGEQRVTVDMSVYYNQYEDFIANKNVVVPFYGDVDLTQTAPVGPGGAQVPLALVALGSGDFTAFQTYTNSAADISSYGATIGLNTSILGGFNLGLNYTYAKFDFDQSTDPDFEAGFNTPEHKVKLQFGKRDLFENFGFNINARWQDEYRWESTFLDATIASRTVLDAQINYRVPKWKSVFKLGGANLTGQEYVSAPGVGAIGSQYYLSWTINN
ncbi:carboxypeptidase-like regulatory domain-containing protein [Polaribacter pectinis]|uniref:Carboxypeptidase-like regulatory domain-containing protein n=1 Tax=Polaribacter pectinis TaxID=2738844 RepID=A0A7G9L8X3_9FLAO|nr:TonB-dependent receptor [Polaribacter pectinis]QNM85072.1 carboxypeptidase-like regulatory domain-containing protein [Polaribacter pectinis]